ncbi:unnamed protein product [Bursaphelenchus xylophilus]|uniref:(pine wood nematode) hypothetical protein n=1 Tax=Bursaphelenchus xylophilus TaxID=6326 RepID=A0A1I7RTJ5_BURXY|nr:unnamed protein product [Bursaphelenchus xylophilus]CAG9122395.1 unnamed protein product [Bursaphelenchus xylophilus]
MTDFDVLLLDIEGTTTSISFVKDVLFPYARDNVEKFLKENSSSDEVKPVLEDLLKVSNELAGQVSEVTKVESISDVDSIVKNVKYWISKDLKLKPLKDLQGLIWVFGYKNNDYKAHVYDDTPRLFERAREAKIPINIYSSGSVFAQKLLFGHTSKGDLNGFIKGYFDTSVGSKVEAQSYRNIAKELGVPADRILFVTDVDKEAFAAKEAGLKVLISVRRGNSELSDEARERFSLIKTFDEIDL